MGNTTANSNTPNGFSNHQKSASQSISFSSGMQKEPQNKIYKEILKDIAKLRRQDRNTQYNPHRRKQSILTNLPNHLKQYSNNIHVVNEFWLKNMKALNYTQLNAIAMLLYCHLYCQSNAKQRQLLLKANQMRVPTHTLKIFTIFEYLVRRITDENPESHIKLFKQLRTLGALHNRCLQEWNCAGESFDIFEEEVCDSKSVIYSLILNSFNYAMEQTFEAKYTVRTRFCFTQLYTVIVDIMNSNDLESLVMSPQNALLKEIDGFLGSLQDCLSDAVGSKYFLKYLEEHFCAENYLFHEAVQRYKLMKDNQRIKIGTHIIETFIEKSAEKQVNLSSSTRNKILTIVQLANKMDSNKQKYQTMLHSNSSFTAKSVVEMSNKNEFNISEMIHSLGFTLTLFDEAYSEVFYLMTTNSWLSFRNTILGFCNNEHFTEQQQLKVRKQKLLNSEKQKLIKNVHDLAQLHKSEKRKSAVIIVSPKGLTQKCFEFGDIKSNESGNTAEQHLKIPMFGGVTNKTVQRTRTPVVLSASRTSMLKLIPFSEGSNKPNPQTPRTPLTSDIPASNAGNGLPNSPPLVLDISATSYKRSQDFVSFGCNTPQKNKSPIGDVTPSKQKAVTNQHFNI